MDEGRGLGRVQKFFEDFFLNAKTYIEMISIHFC
jgi:hypothetical protein